MKHEIEDQTGQFKKLSVEIPQETVAQEYQNTLEAIRKNVELKGFRKGKAPLSFIESNYGRSAETEVARILIEKNLGQILREKSLQPVAYPKIQHGPAKKNEAFSFTATFETMPEVELKDYSGFRYEKTPTEVTEEEKNAALDHLRDRLATLNPAIFGSEARIGHVVKINHLASEAGAPVKEASGEDSLIEIGKAFLGQEFDDKIVGMKEGETRFISIKFPEDAAPFGGRTIDFQVTVKSLMNKVLPELNDEFAKKVSGLTSFAEFEQRLEADLKMEKEHNQLSEVKEKFTDWLVEKNPVVCPETLLHNQMQYLARQTAENLARMGLEQKAIEDKLKEWQDELNRRASNQVKASLLLGAISVKEQIQAGEEELRYELVRVAQSTGKKPEEVFKELQEKGLLFGVLKQLTELKTLDTLARKVVETSS